MKKLVSIASAGFLSLAGVGIVMPSAMAANTFKPEPVAFPTKICAYEHNGWCTGWYPNEDTCKNIFLRKTATPDQIRACIAWSGFGSRG